MLITEYLAEEIATPWANLIYKEFIEEHRWYTVWLHVFEYEDKLWGVHYFKPATELQEGQDSWDFDDDGLIECWEVAPYEYTETRYRALV